MNLVLHLATCKRFIRSLTVGSLFQTGLTA